MITKMKEVQIRNEIIELIDLLSGSERSTSKSCNLRDLLDYLRMVARYTMLDLEATRRESKGSK